MFAHKMFSKFRTVKKAFNMVRDTRVHTPIPPLQPHKHTRTHTHTHVCARPLRQPTCANATLSRLTLGPHRPTRPPVRCRPLRRREPPGVPPVARHARLQPVGLRVREVRGAVRPAQHRRHHVPTVPGRRRLRHPAQRRRGAQPSQELRAAVDTDAAAVVGCQAAKGAAAQAEPGDQGCTSQRRQCVALAPIVLRQPLRPCTLARRAHGGRACVPSTQPPCDHLQRCWGSMASVSWPRRWAST